MSGGGGILTYFILRQREEEREQANNARLQTLDAYAATLNAQGTPVMSWPAFLASRPEEKPDRWGNSLKSGFAWAAIGALAGALISALFSTPFVGALGGGAMVGAAFGAVKGLWQETENTRRSGTLDKYAAYLGIFEHAAGRGRAPQLTMESAGLPTRDDHVRHYQQSIAEPFPGR